MPLVIKTDPPPLRVDEHGVVRLGDTRVMLELVVHAADEGASAEEIVERYPSLGLADVHATLAYILRHRSEIDAYMTESEAQAEETRRLIEERSPQEGLREELKRRLAEQVERYCDAGYDREDMELIELQAFEDDP
jgi:uncharacterized protein (DUF433 family)